jgi:hypothetical protein
VSENCPEMHTRYQPLYSSDFPFPLAEPSPDPVMVTRPCGCTSMISDPEGRPIQVSWCDSHDPGYEPRETSR